MTYALIEAPRQGWTLPIGVIAVVGAMALVAFPVIEQHRQTPLLPPRIFRSLQFSGANLTTFAVYSAMGAGMFLLVLQLQQSMGYSALSAGTATLPTTIIMLLASPRIGALGQRTGPRLLMTAGPFIAAGGLALMARITPGAGYVCAVLPAVIVFGLGLSVTVAPLTSTMLAAVSDNHVGAASGVNNAISRIASLLAIAVLPAVAGIAAGPGQPLGAGFPGRR